jgi:YesN/AraC family two-component response regulator
MNINKATEWLQLHNNPYWRIEQGGKPVSKSNEAEEGEKGKSELSLDESISFFMQNAELLPDGWYVLKARKNAKGTAGEMQFRFKIEISAGSSSTGHQVAGIGSVEVLESKFAALIAAKMEAQDQKYQAMLKEQKHEFELQELKKELKEAKEEKGAVGIDKIGEVIGQVNQMFTNYRLMNVPSNPAKVAGPTAAVSPANSPEKVIETALEDLHSVMGDDLPSKLAKLAEMAKANPEQFKTYLNML